LGEDVPIVAIVEFVILCGLLYVNVACSVLDRARISRLFLAFSAWFAPRLARLTIALPPVTVDAECAVAVLVLLKQLDTTAALLGARLTMLFVE